MNVSLFSDVSDYIGTSPHCKKTPRIYSAPGTDLAIGAV